MRAALFTLVVCAGILSVTSCKNNKPAREVAGTYTGAFSAEYNDSTFLLSDGFVVQVDELTKNSVSVLSTGFDQFELLVTWNGINVVRVDPDDPNVTKFEYIADEKRLLLDYEKDGNWAVFNGTK
ncbi:MAG: hypothetical protein MI810_14950 [Flavobacteriales bacterium]|nr:hypothetical protein [Flavobacteriales bacterium]